MIDSILITEPDGIVLIEKHMADIVSRRIVIEYFNDPDRSPLAVVEDFFFL